ncbi:MAG: hypothetical protein AAGJ28_01485 [Pseudomonadota bacterium]
MMGKLERLRRAALSRGASARTVRATVAHAATFILVKSGHAAQSGI